MVKKIGIALAGIALVFVIATITFLVVGGCIMDSVL